MLTVPHVESIPLIMDMDVVRPPHDPVALPPTGVPRTVNPDESKSECDSEKRSSVVVSQQMKPQVKPKPASLVTKQKKESLSHSNLKASAELKPKIKPKFL